MSNILQAYKLEFARPIIFGSEYKSCKSNDELMSNTLVDFLNENNGVDELSEIISIIRDTMIPGHDSLEYSDDLLNVYITSTNVEFMMLDSDYPNKPVDYTMPTDDFVQILELWLKFLSQEE